MQESTLIEKQNRKFVVTNPDLNGTFYQKGDIVNMLDKSAIDKLAGKATEERRKENIKKECMLELSMVNELSNRAIEGWCREAFKTELPEDFGEVKIKEFSGSKIMEKVCEYLLSDIKTSPIIYNKPNKKSMCETLKDNIVEFAKNAALKLSDPDEFTRREAGLKDSEGNWTDSAKFIAIQKKSEQAGFKDGQDMMRKLGINSINLSAFELNTLFTEFAADLLAIAKAKVESEK